MESSANNPGTFTQYLELLDQQYSLVQEFANAQTNLYNVTNQPSKTSSSSRNNGILDDNDEDDEFGGGSSKILRAVGRLEDAKSSVRSNFIRLQEFGSTNSNAINRNLLGLHKEHLALSQRVVGTICSNLSWHPNGIVNDAALAANNENGNIQESLVKGNTVAIAVLNASIARIKDTVEEL